MPLGRNEDFDGREMFTVHIALVPPLETVNVGTDFYQAIDRIKNKMK